MYKESTFISNCNKFVDKEFEFDGTQVLNYKPVMKKGQGSLTVTLVGKMIPQDSLLIAMTDKLPDYHLGGTRLRILQGDTGNDGFDVKQATSSMLRDMYQVTQATISRQQDVIDSLKVENALMSRNDSMGAIISPEIKVLFPQVRDIAVTRGIVSDVDTHRLDTLNLVLVNYSGAMGAAQSRKFKEYLEARLGTRPITIVASSAVHPESTDRK